MPPKPDIKYYSPSAHERCEYSFEKPDGKIDCDTALSITASIITMSCIVAYFIYLSLR
jgi:hypothetical protein